MVFGIENCGWLKALKNSARNWSWVLSLGQCRLAVRMMARSRFDWPGPSTIPVELLPKVVPIPSAPTMGGVVKQEELKYLIRWDEKVDPDHSEQLS